MSVQNDVNLGPSGHIVVDGNLNGLTVNGIFQGQGTSAIDLSVGLDLTNFTVLGGSSNLGSVHSANIAVGKNIVGLNIQHGVFNSLITAGNLIDGSPQNSSSGGNIGPDGTDAIFDSQILAGVEIKNLTINGNVTSDYVTNPQLHPTGYPTRIVAGEVLEDAPRQDPRAHTRRGPSPRAGTSTTSRSSARWSTRSSPRASRHSAATARSHLLTDLTTMPRPRPSFRAARDSTPTMLRPESSSAGQRASEGLH